jgi:hypothetical protein
MNALGDLIASLNPIKKTVAKNAAPTSPARKPALSTAGYTRGTKGKLLDLKV